ncbi:hypothetical protein LTR85_009459 [Meristemomyces frigidus]|nr:hypothetical protein LTR85_009459 [Meristemomyces frigidus]
MRRVSRAFKDLIDVPKHTRAIARDIESRAKKRLQAVIDDHLTFSPAMSFLDALARFTAHRKIGPLVEEHYRCTSGSANLWYQQLAGHPPPHGHQDDQLVSYLGAAARTLLNVHMRYHTRDTKAVWWERIKEASVLDIPQAVRTHYGWEDRTLRRWYRLLQSTPGGYLRGVAQPEQLGPGNGSHLPMWSITDLPYCQGDGYAPNARTGAKPAICRIRDVVQQYSVPQIPDVGQLSYCARTVWAWETLKEVAVDGRVLDPLVRAAVLDEMFIY